MHTVPRAATSVVCCFRPMVGSANSKVVRAGDGEPREMTAGFYLSCACVSNHDLHGGGGASTDSFSDR